MLYALTHLRQAMPLPVAAAPGATQAISS